MEALKKQGRILLFFCDESNREVRRIRINNNFKSQIQSIEKILQEVSPWTMEEFGKAKETLYEQYPAGEDLWKAVSSISEIICKIMPIKTKKHCKKYSVF